MSTANVDRFFDRAFPETCKRIRCNPLHLLAVMLSESEVNPSAHNPHGDASGLIQFMPDTLRALGWRNGDQAFRGLSASQQLPFVESYYRPWAHDAGAWDSPARLYQATFLPGTLRTVTKPDGVLAAKGGRLGWAFEANSVFDFNRDKTITLGELGEAITHAIGRNVDRWMDLSTRIGLEAEAKKMTGATVDSGIPVTAREVQHALNVLGASPALTEDGAFGPKSTAAVRTFQESHGLTVDGRAGPITRKALAAAVAALGATEG